MPLPNYPPQLPTRYRYSPPALINSLLPSLLRRPKMLAWLESLCSPVVRLYSQFTDFVASTRRELSYNGQTLMLEKALNDRFDEGFRRIRIINADTVLDPVYLNFVREQQPMPPLYDVAEQQPPLYLSRWANYVNQVGFTVLLPRSLASREAAVQARIKQLKLALIKHTLIYQ